MELNLQVDKIETRSIKFGVNVVKQPADRIAAIGSISLGVVQTEAKHTA
jgi:hypothetical protein